MASCYSPKKSGIYIKGDTHYSGKGLADPEGKKRRH